MAILLSDSYKVINWDLNSKMLDTVYWGKTTDSGRGVKVAINQNGVLKTPTTETMRINFKKPSGLQIFIDGVISGNYFVFDFTEQVYAEQGNVLAELMLNVSSEFVMSSTFIIEVNQSFTSAIESSSEFTALQTALADVDQMNIDISALKNPTFTEAVALANIASGESQATLWGKVKKMFSFIGTTTLTTTATTITTAINELVTKNTLTDIVFTPISGYAFSGQFYVRNKEVHVIGVIDKTSGTMTVPFNQSIGTFSSTYAPSSSITTNADVYGDGFIFGSASLAITSTGGLSFTHGTANAKSMRINASWKIA